MSHAEMTTTTSRRLQSVVLEDWPPPGLQLDHFWELSCSPQDGSVSLVAEHLIHRLSGRA